MPRQLTRIIRALVPPTFRSRLRRSPVVRKLLNTMYGGIRERKHPFAPYQFFFDGGRDMGFAVGDISAEEAEFTCVRRLLEEKPARVIWDVGANVGYWTLFLSGLPHPAESIVSFEPDVTNLRLLRMNVERNTLTRVTVRDCALSDAPGEATFFADDYTGATGSLDPKHAFVTKYFGQRTRPVKVAVSTIDGEVERLGTAPDFLKIDVEGHEVAVLRGASRTLANHRPRLIVEVSPTNETAIGDLFREHRYRMINPVNGQKISTPAWNTVAVPIECERS